MVGLHVWSSLESYEVLGFFGKHLLPSQCKQLTNMIDRMVLWRLLY